MKGREKEIQNGRGNNVMLYIILVVTLNINELNVQK